MLRFASLLIPFSMKIPLVVSSVMCISTWFNGNDYVPSASGGRFIDGMLDIQVGCLISLVVRGIIIVNIMRS